MTTPLSAFCLPRIALLTLLASCTPTNTESGKKTDSGAGTHSTPLPACATPQPILTLAGKETGFVRCKDGAVNRVGSWTGDPDTYSSSYEDTTHPAYDTGCDTPAGCGDPQQRCVVEGWCMVTETRCVHVCGSDADCGENELCVPPEAYDAWPRWPVCMAATDISCRTGEDCSSGECGIFWAGEQPRVLGLACRTEADECRDAGRCNNTCVPWGDKGAWECEAYYDCD